ncbi:MAG: ABC transporter permease [Acidimicrobiia bacterium]
MAKPVERVKGRFMRTMAFFKKDTLEVFRQPRLLITLVLGPFLILFLFGVGFNPEPPVLRTVVVAPSDSGIAERSEQLADALGPQARLVGTLTSVEEAEAMLASGEANVAVVIPSDVVETVRGGEQAVITILHDQIDPFESSVVELFAQSAVDQVNREVLEEVVAAGQGRAAEIGAPLPAAQAAVAAMAAAVDANDRAAFESSRADLVASLDELARRVATSNAVLDAVGEQASSDDSGSAIDSALANSDRLSQPDVRDERAEILSALEQNLEQLETDLENFQAIEPAVLVSPFRGESSGYGGIEVDFTHYYIPGVVSLLVQHLALTFAALSLVRERTLGSVELFRVSPLSGAEVLAGKYLANVVIGLLVGAALTAASVFAFGFQPEGPWWWYGLAVLLVVLASQGLGFVLSALAKTESQAVQYAMITLLVSIFFSGFFISTARLLPAVQVVSYLIPATYGIKALQDIAFWGRLPSIEIILGAVLYSFVLGALALAFMRRRVTGAQLSRKQRRSARAAA